MRETVAGIAFGVLLLAAFVLGVRLSRAPSGTPARPLPSTR